MQMHWLTHVDARRGVYVYICISRCDISLLLRPCRFLELCLSQAVGAACTWKNAPKVEILASYADVAAVFVKTVPGHVIEVAVLHRFSMREAL